MFCLAYNKSKHRQTPPVDLADTARQKLMQKRKALEARAPGVRLPSELESETKAESNLVACVET